MAWATRDQAREHWEDSEKIADGTLDVLLEVATTSCAAFAKALPEVVPPAEPVIPTNYMIATVLQAREVWAAAQREGDVIGVGDYAVRARPLTATVRQLLRPVTPFLVG